jgi:hypothetical protein
MFLRRCRARSESPNNQTCKIYRSSRHLKIIRSEYILLIPSKGLWRSFPIVFGLNHPQHQQILNRKASNWPNCKFIVASISFQEVWFQAQSKLEFEWRHWTQRRLTMILYFQICDNNRHNHQLNSWKTRFLL